MRFKFVIAVAAALGAMSTGAFAEGDAAKGEKVFKKCKACHAADKAKNKVGPHLVGIIGRKAGSVEGYKYGKGLTAAAEKIGEWDEAKLADYLANPKEYIGGKSKMTFKLKKEDQRKDVAAYLASLNK
ncbi:c-type cytochrome [Anderseniella sp. Alg231-50]|uniref:c-type cytochrome n=1 Tax=Anderseniella sp. Alg231-50 TaxID=1922226 RepID=UPI000D55AFF7